MQVIVTETMIIIIIIIIIIIMNLWTEFYEKMLCSVHLFCISFALNSHSEQHTLFMLNQFEYT